VGAGDKPDHLASPLSRIETEGHTQTGWHLPARRFYHRHMNEQPPGQDEPRSDEQSPDEQPVHERSDKANDYDDPVDDASDDSFPASDPPSFTDSTATRNPR
jgi:hypothetical protein